MRKKEKKSNPKIKKTIHIFSYTRRRKNKEFSMKQGFLQGFVCIFKSFLVLKWENLRFINLIFFVNLWKQPEEDRKKKGDKSVQKIVLSGFLISRTLFLKKIEKEPIERLHAIDTPAKSTSNAISYTWKQSKDFGLHKLQSKGQA